MKQEAEHSGQFGEETYKNRQGARIFENGGHISTSRAPELCRSGPCKLGY